jgi:hypothetical protein
VWRKLRKQIAVEREMLNQLLTDFRPLLCKCADTPPDRIEVSALAAMLHGFYNGVENIFKRVALELGEDLPRQEGWHKALLAQMTRPGADRPAVLSPELADRLVKYLEFRHLFRNAYPFQLRWDRMENEVGDVEAVLNSLEAEIAVFLKATEGKQ